MKKGKDFISFELQEFANFFGTDAFICPDCGTLHPNPEWAQKKNECLACKDRPSKEDIEREKKSNE